LFIGGLSLEVTEVDVENYFSKFGVVKDVVVMIDRYTNRSRGFGFVTFEEDDSIADVFKINNHQLLGKWIEVKRAQSKNERGISNNNHNHNHYSDSVNHSNTNTNNMYQRNVGYNQFNYNNQQQLMYSNGLNFPMPIPYGYVDPNYSLPNYGNYSMHQVQQRFNQEYFENDGLQTFIKIVYHYYHPNGNLALEILRSDLQTLNNTLLSINIKITSLYIYRNIISGDGNVDEIMYQYNEDGIFYISKTEKSDIIVDNNVKEHLSQLLKT
jgi:RNA recognition motif-containing protein